MSGSFHENPDAANVTGILYLYMNGLNLWYLGISTVNIQVPFGAYGLLGTS